MGTLEEFAEFFKHRAGAPMFVLPFPPTGWFCGNEGNDMRIDELKKAKDQRPFQPFLIEMEDGRAMPVRHPDAVAWDPDRARIAVRTLQGGGWEVIDVALVKSLGLPATSATAESNADGGQA
jgi:hypothetical protein